MNKCLLLTLTVFLVMLSQAVAQQGSISGSVVDRATALPMVGTTVALYTQDDAALLRGGVTDDDGAFRLAGVERGRYRLVLSFIGYEDAVLDNIVVEGNVDVGRMELESTAILMDEVEVTGERSVLEHTLEKTIYHVEKDIMAESGSASDVLQNIPSVSVDIDGNVSLRNSGNITFFIDGRPSALLRRNAAAALEQMSAHAIERIEIITNPSARYRPDGVGGLINIVMKKESGEGFSGQLGASAGNEGRYNANANLNYGMESIRLFGNYSLRKSGRTVLYGDSRVFKDAASGLTNSMLEEDGSSIIDALSHTFSVGANVDLDEQNSLELSGMYFLQNADHLGTSNVAGFASDASLRESYRDTQTNEEYESEGEGAFAFEHVFADNEDHLLSVEATIAGYDEREDQRYEQSYSVPVTTTEASSNLVEKNGTQTETALRYVRPIGEDATLESGYAGTFIRDDIRYTRVVDATRFLFDQDVHALYATYGQSIEDFSFKAGLRAEQTTITSELAAPTDSLIPNDYFKLFPTLHLGYELDAMQRISISYSRRINRPDADELNPYREYSDARTAEAGNPLLLPEQTHSLELGYQAILEEVSFTNTLYYRNTYDAFTSIRSGIGDSIVLYTVDNLKTQDALGFESVISGSIGENADYDLTGNVYYTTIDATNLGYEENKSVVTGRIKAYVLLRIFEHTSLQTTGYYYFPSITPQGRRDPYHYFNAGIKQTFFDNRLSATLSVTDVLHSFAIERSTRSAALDQDFFIKRKEPVVYFGMTWRFNSAEEKPDHLYEGDSLVK